MAPPIDRRGGVFRIRRNTRGVDGVVAPSAPLLLDSHLAEVSGAYSLRRLTNTYSGPCLRVRRSSDDAEADIGWDGDVMDTAALLAHVGAASGFVRTWYDQTGTNQLQQATTANQLRIVNGGALDTFGVSGEPAMVKTAATTSLRSASAYTHTALSVLAVWEHTATISGDTAGSIIIRNTGAPMFGVQATNAPKIGRNGLAWTVVAPNNTSINSTPFQFSALGNGADSASFRINSALIGSVASSGASNAELGVLEGNMPGGGVHKTSEVIVYNVMTPTQLVVVEASQIAHWVTA